MYTNYYYYLYSQTWSSVLSFFPFQEYCNTKLEVDYQFPLHFYLLHALSLFCGLLRAIGLHHREPLISNSVNIGGDDKAFYIGLRRHQIPPLVYSSSRMGFHYTFSFPRSQFHQALHILQQRSWGWWVCSSSSVLMCVILLFLINGRSHCAAMTEAVPLSHHPISVDLMKQNESYRLLIYFLNKIWCHFPTTLESNGFIPGLVFQDFGLHHCWFLKDAVT